MTKTAYWWNWNVLQSMKTGGDRRWKCAVKPCYLLLARLNSKCFYILLVFLGLCQDSRICCDYNFLVPLALLSRQNLPQTATASSPSTTTCWSWKANGGRIPTNIEWYKKTVWTIAWVQLAMVFCYFPTFISLILATGSDYRRGSIFHVCAATVVYFNSTLNPILFFWKIREVRQVVKTTVLQIRCFWS